MLKLNFYFLFKAEEKENHKPVLGSGLGFWHNELSVKQVAATYQKNMSSRTKSHFPLVQFHLSFTSSHINH